MPERQGEWAAVTLPSTNDTLTKPLRHRPAKPMGSPCVGSNPTGVVFLQNNRKVVRLGACARAYWMGPGKQMGRALTQAHEYVIVLCVNNGWEH